jgi:hypothetical protein
MSNMFWFFWHTLIFGNICKWIPQSILLKGFWSKVLYNKWKYYRWFWRNLTTTLNWAVIFNNISLYPQYMPSKKFLFLMINYNTLFFTLLWQILRIKGTISWSRISNLPKLCQCLYICLSPLISTASKLSNSTNNNKSFVWRYHM